MKPYELQATMDGGMFGGSELVRASDGETICVDYGEPEDKTFTRDFAPLVAELNRLAIENETLKNEQDERTTRLKAEVERLRKTAEAREAEARGQQTLWD